MLKTPRRARPEVTLPESGSESAYHGSPLGTIRSTWTDGGLFRLSWEDGKAGSDSPTEDLRSATVSPRVAEFDRLLRAFFSGECDALQHVRVDSSGWTPFFTDIYNACREIPAGRTCRYAELAEAVGRPRAVRAVGQAMARNRLPLVIPCHRVIGSDGRLRGFSAPGGLDTKRTLLDLERAKKAPIQEGLDTLIPSPSRKEVVQLLSCGNTTTLPSRERGDLTR